MYLADVLSAKERAHKGERERERESVKKKERRKERYSTKLTLT